jgi:lysophospholipase L1-like esterase
MQSRTFRTLGGVLATLVVVFSWSCIAKADSQNSNDWLQTTPLNLQKDGDVTALPPGGNKECAQISPEGCVVTTDYGSVIGSTVKFNGTSSYRSVDTAFMPINNSNAAITTLPGAPFGSYIGFTNNFSSSISSVFNGFQSIYQINNPPDAKLADKSGKLLSADMDSIGFSSNGQWMILSSPHSGMLRVNLDTFQVLPFGSAYRYDIGRNPGVQTAITNDGRYAVESSITYSTFTIYDLSTCAEVPYTITGPVSCQSKTVDTFLKQQIPDYVSSVRIRFMSNDTLSFYMVYNDGPTRKISKYYLGTDNLTNGIEYLTLGDSYISGEGAFQYKDGTDTSNNKCHLSNHSYPYLLGQALNLTSYNSVACSGARTQDIIDTSDSYGGQILQKVPRKNITSLRVDEILASYEPGYLDQLNFVSKYHPKNVTISVGGNDIGFGKILAGCLKPATCYSTYEDRVELVRQINSKFSTLVDTYQKIKDNDASGSNIYVVGYPQIAQPGGSCGRNVHMNAQEIKFSTQLIAYLNSVIENATANAGVAYIDISHALDKYKLCEGAPGLVAVNGLTAGTDHPDFLKVTASESYHPNELGHQLIEEKILSATNRFSLAMPNPDPAAKAPSETDLDILNAPKSGRQTNSVNFDGNLSNDVQYRGSPWSITLKGTKSGLKAKSSVKAVLYSTPIDLGTFSTNSFGDLNVQIQAPSDIPTGFHTLHIYGTNIAGDPTDIYNVIYVAASVSDFDGDGISNSQNPCLIFQPSWEDSDKDGLDDSCDGFIGKPPVQESLNNQSQTLASGSAQVSPLAALLSSEIIARAANTQTPDINISSPSTEDAPSVGKVLATNTKNQPPRSSNSNPKAKSPFSWIKATFIALIILVLARLTFRKFLKSI